MAIPPVDVPRSLLKKAGSKVPGQRSCPTCAPGGRPGITPDLTLRVDIRLKRGIWVTGRVLDPSTGKPVLARARVFRVRRQSQPQGVSWLHWARNNPISTDKDRTFHLVAFPGPGVLAASVSPGEKGRSTYMMGAGLDRFKHGRDERVLPTQPSLVCAHELSGPSRDRSGTGYRLNTPRPGARNRAIIDSYAARSRKVKPLKGTRISGLNDSGPYWACDAS